MLKQRTIRNSIHAKGVGLHSGREVRLTIRPALPDTGIVYRRVDLGDGVCIPAVTANVVDTKLATTIGIGEVRVSTVEHLMSAFAGLGIDNAYVELDAPEVPIMDGSAAPFVFLLQSAGLEEQDKPKKFIKIRKPIYVDQGDSKVSLAPHEGFKVECTLVYEHLAFNGCRQHAAVDFSTENFIHGVSRARTFGFLADIEHLRNQNLALGGSLENALVLDDHGIVNEGELRHEDEFVRHKILDTIGDLYMLGHNLIGAYSGYKSGHTTNHALAKQLLCQPDVWEMVTFDDFSRTPHSYGGLYAEPGQVN